MTLQENIQRARLNITKNLLMSARLDYQQNMDNKSACEIVRLEKHYSNLLARNGIEETPSDYLPRRYK